MADYIKRKDALSAVLVLNERQRIKELPAEDVAPVKPGKWILYPRAHYFKCSECKYTVPYRKAMLKNNDREYHYCPHCGAKMDLEGSQCG